MRSPAANTAPDAIEIDIACLLCLSLDCFVIVVILLLHCRTVKLLHDASTYVHARSICNAGQALFDPGSGQVLLVWKAFLAM